MNNVLYKKTDHELPYNIDTRYFKNVSEGEVKEKWEQRWVVYTSKVNDFVVDVPQTYNGHALTGIDREDRGPLTVVTLNYGDEELNSDYKGDGETEWWTYGGSVYSYHIRRWVNNTPSDIKNFCTSCVRNYGYEKDEVTVNCNPSPGAPKVMCEATFTPNIEIEEENDPTTGEGWGEDEEASVVETSNGYQVQVGWDTIDFPQINWIMYNMGCDRVKAENYIMVIKALERGEIRWLEKGSMGDGITESGWYSTDDTNPNAAKNVVYNAEAYGDKETIAKAEVYYSGVPQLQVPTTRVTTTTTVKASERKTLQDLLNNSANLTQSQGDLTVGGQTIKPPQEQKGRASDGSCSVTLASNVWQPEGASFDASSIRKKSSLSTGKSYYEGTMTQTWVSTCYLPAYGESASSISLS